MERTSSLSLILGFSALVAGCGDDAPTVSHRRTSPVTKQEQHAVIVKQPDAKSGEPNAAQIPESKAPNQEPKPPVHEDQGLVVDGVSSETRGGSVTPVVESTPVTLSKQGATTEPSPATPPKASVAVDGTSYDQPAVDVSHYSLSPGAGSVAGGYSLTVTLPPGQYSLPGAEIRLGGALCPITSENGATITCTVAAHAAGTVDVTYQNAGAPAIVIGMFNYLVDTTVAPPNPPAPPMPSPIVGGYPMTLYMPMAQYTYEIQYNGGPCTVISWQNGVALVRCLGPIQ